MHTCSTTENKSLCCACKQRSSNRTVFGNSVTLYISSSLDVLRNFNLGLDLVGSWLLTPFFACCLLDNLRTKSQKVRFMNNLFHFWGLRTSNKYV